MTNVIDFAAALHARRVTAALDARASATAQRVASDKAQLADQLGGSIGAAIVADVMVDLRERDASAEFKPMPAYCDPDNERIGSKYEATRQLGTREIAARIRADIKAAQRAGTIAAGFKISVRMDRFAGGSSIDVRVTAAPAGFRMMSDKAASWCKQFPQVEWKMPLSRDEQYTPEYLALKGTLDRIHGAYNRNNSDSMSDYFDVHYYGSAGFDNSLTYTLRAAEIEAASGDYWADDCA